MLIVRRYLQTDILGAISRATNTEHAKIATSSKKVRHWLVYW